MKQIKDYRKEAILNKVFRYPEGIMSRREWLKMQMIKGAYIVETTKNRIDFNRIKFNRMGWDEQKEYEKKCEEKIPCYKLYEKTDSNSYFEITKTEFEAFKALELEMDINTQKNELSEKIEAGTATDEEINAAMEKEFEFAKKYF